MIGALLSGVGKIFGGGGSGDMLGRIGGALFGGGNRSVKRLGQGYMDAEKRSRPLYDQASDRLDPYAAVGPEATGLISSLLGLDGGTSGAEGLNRFRESTGYRDTMNAALGGVTSNAAARGLLGSSGTGKAFQNTAANIAQGSFGDFLSRLTGQQAVGRNAAGAQAEIDAGIGDMIYDSELGRAQVMSKKKGGGFLGSLFG